MGAAPPRLLFLMNEALFFTTHRMPVALAAREAGFEVHVAAPFDAEYVEAIRARGFAYHDIPLNRSGTSLPGEARLFLALLRLIARLRPALVHHVAMKPVIYGGVASRLLRQPAVVHAITGLGFLFLREDAKARLLRALIRPLYGFALHHPNARVIFQNPDDLGLFLRQGLVRQGDVVRIPGCGVDMAVFRPAETAAPRDRPLVMFPARILGDKGVREFVGAARLLRARGMAADFVLVGRRDANNPTDVPEAEIRGWEAEGLLRWRGFSREMPATLREADIVCMPSYREGLPRGLIEAAATGLPIVTADVPGCREVVRHGENGLLVPVRDAAATAEAVGRLLADPALRRRMGARSREIALAEFSVEQFVADTLAAYRAVLPPGLLPDGRHALRPEPVP